MKLTKHDVKLLKTERAYLRDWICEFGDDLPMTKVMKQARVRDINQLLKEQS